MVKKSDLLVNTRLYRETAGALFTATSHQELADALDCSRALVRAALKEPGTSGVRTPPAGWEMTVRRLLEARADHFTKLAKQLSPRE